MKNDLINTSKGRIKYAKAILKRLCSDIGPHPSGSQAYTRVVEEVHSILSPAVPVCFCDRYLEFWHLLSRPEIIYKGKPISLAVAENCSGMRPEGFTAEIRRLQGETPYGLYDIESQEQVAYLDVCQEVHAVADYLLDENILSLPRFIIGTGEKPFIELLVEAKGPVQTRLRVVHADDSLTHNVVASVPGQTENEIIVSAHIDSIIQTEGANDNMATAVVAMMLAQTFAKIKIPKTLTFVFTGGEEYGLVGARHYARRREKERSNKRIQFAINLDSLTYGPNLWITTEDKELVDIIKQVHEDLSISTDPIYQNSSCWINDAQCFALLNDRIRGVNFNSRGYETLAANHTPDDDVKNVPFDCIENSFITLYRFIEKLLRL